MRPHRIEMEGFGTFVGRTVIEFDDVDLVAFVGPTGSGKSTVIDALTFALYGSVARYDDARLVAPVISQAGNEARVRLDFEAAGAAHTVVRVVRRKKVGASTKEARLQRGEDVLASGAKEVSEAVERLLGLDFTQFTRTVVLPQGEFAKFLKDDPRQRQELLSRLLDLGLYSRMGGRAREVAKAASIKADVLAEQLGSSVDVTPESVAAAEARVVALEAFQGELGAHLGRIDELEGQLVEMRRRRGELATQVDALGKIATPDGVEDLARRAGAASLAVSEADEALASARSARDDAEAAVAAAGEPSAHRARLAQLSRVEELAAAVAEGEEERAGLSGPLAKAGSAVEAATAAAQAASSALERARAHADAAAWTSQLSVGEPCPVCLQDVVAVPEHDAGEALAEASSTAAAAVAGVEAARAELATVERRSDLLTSRLGEQRTELAKLRAELPDGLDASSISVSLAGAERAVEAQKDALERVRAAERAASAAQQAVKAVAGDEASARRHLGEARDGVAVLGPPAPEGESLVDDWHALVAWAGAEGERLARQLDALTEEGKTVRAGQDARWAELAAIAAPLGFEVAALRADARGIVATALADGRSLAGEQARRLAELAKLADQQAAAERERAVHSELGRLLKADGFERWLLAEAVADLVDRATGRLFELSNGQFSLAATETSFEIVDHRNAEARRDVRTLSGGETFLASLALALALADSIADLAPVETPRLESMFLDEGFGTLDPDTLDLVATAIEELSASGRLVGIVTHIEALAERMPVRFVIRKEPGGSIVQKVAS